MIIMSYSMCKFNMALSSANKFIFTLIQVKELRRMGGQSYGHAVRRLLYLTISNEVGLLFSWNGAKQKRPFKNLHLAKGILGMFRLFYLQKYSYIGFYIFKKFFFNII